MKTIIALLFICTAAFSQVKVDIRNNAKLEWEGAKVKQKFHVLYYAPVFEGSQDFVIRGVIEMYANNAGAYGGYIPDLIQADTTLSSEEKEDLVVRYGNKEVPYTTAGKYTDVNGNRVTATTPGAIPELQYWSGFKLNHASLGMTSASTQGALDAQIKILTAIVKRLDLRKNF